MTLPVLVREMLPSERSMVKSDWKKDLWDAKPAWGRALQSEEWWALVNHVVDGITLPTCEVWMACHRNEPSVALCWAARRKDKLLHMHAVEHVRREPELAASLERDLRAHLTTGPEWTWNPFLELKRAPS